MSSFTEPQQLQLFDEKGLKLIDICQKETALALTNLPERIIITFSLSVAIPTLTLSNRTLDKVMHNYQEGRLGRPQMPFTSRSTDCLQGPSAVLGVQMQRVHSTDSSRCRVSCHHHCANHCTSVHSSFPVSDFSKLLLQSWDACTKLVLPVFAGSDDGVTNPDPLQYILLLSVQNTLLRQPVVRGLHS